MDGACLPSEKEKIGFELEKAGVYSVLYDCFVNAPQPPLLVFVLEVS